MQNVGTPDRIARLVIGALLILAPLVTGWALFTNPLLMWGSLIIGVVLIATALFSFCPIYAALGLSTKPKQLS
ncbi:YgaP family membrane protein [Devosia sp.]|uniref:YgaP family membrane protein n=1 Tax=Devosia sp. TaxID=1871048 RepID=UPI003BA91A80